MLRIKRHVSLGVAKETEERKLHPIQIRTSSSLVHAVLSFSSPSFLSLFLLPFHPSTPAFLQLSSLYIVSACSKNLWLCVISLPQSESEYKIVFFLLIWNCLGLGNWKESKIFQFHCFYFFGCALIENTLRGNARMKLFLFKHF